MLIVSLKDYDKNIAAKLWQENPDYFLEYRLDLMNNWCWINSQSVNEKVILTIRDQSEDHENCIIKIADWERKIQLYSHWQNSYNCFTDIELSLWKNLNENQKNSLVKDKLILSWHNYKKFEVREVSKIIAEMEAAKAKLAKLCLKVNWKDFLAISSLIRNARCDLLIAFLGEEGLSQRLLYKHIGAKGTYLSLPDKSVAAGQPDTTLSRKVKLPEVYGDEMISGIIGGKQVTKSLGLEYYNNHFIQKKISTRYLPFIVNNLADFIKWIRESGLKFKGFSVTMPWKMKLAVRIKSNRKTVNFWDGNKRTGNTDIMAMRKILKELNLPKNSRILIAGSGGSAHSVLTALQEFDCLIDISSRNFLKGLALSKEFKCRYLIPENTKDRSYNLLINTTPLGMNNENLLDMIQGRDFEAVVDLPYNNEETPLEIFCRSRNTQYISGKEFWHKQAKFQVDYFCR